MKRSLVSVIVPAYNAAGYIGEALASVASQSLADWEAIIVDDGSTDSTCECVQPFLEDPRFSLIEQENKGVSAARNAAVRRAVGDWVAFLDADDAWLPEKLETQVSLATRASRRGAGLLQWDRVR